MSQKRNFDKLNTAVLRTFQKDLDKTEQCIKVNIKF